MTYYSFNEFHLGDNLVHLHFLRKLATRYPEHHFIHAVQPCHMAQLEEAVKSIANVDLISLEGVEFSKCKAHSRNVWKNAGATVVKPGEQVKQYVAGFWEQHPLRADHVGFHLAWFAHLAQEMGLESPFKTASDLLFDYPLPQLNRDARSGLLGTKSFDFLVINSQPCSGQLKSYDGAGYFAPLCEALQEHGYSVVTTDPLLRNCVTPPLAEIIPCTRGYGLTISGIGALSLRCKYIVGVATGPLWPCLNVQNRDKFMVVLLDHVLGAEDLTGLKQHLVQVKNREAAMEALRVKGLL